MREGVKVDLLIPTYRGMNPMSTPLIQSMVTYSHEQGVDIRVPPLHGSALVHRSRNKAVMTVRPDTDFILFCDDDMGPRKEALCQLLAHDLPVVSAFMTTREELPVKIAAHEYSAEHDVFKQLEWLRPCKVVKGSLGMGTGFLLMQKQVLDRALDWFLEARDWLADNRRSFDRMHVRADVRERERLNLAALRRVHWDHEKLHRVFHFAILENQTEAGEDLSFSRNLLRMGIETAIDTNVIVSHIGWFPYSPANLYDLNAEEIVAA